MKPACIFACVACIALVAAAPQIKTEHFDHDPGWDSFENRQTPTKLPQIEQSFGYSRTNHAATQPGEIGGVVCRAGTPAWYAMKLDSQRTLDRPLRVSGTFSIPEANGGVIFFGFFNSNAVLPGGRPPNAVGLHINASHDAALIHIRLHCPDNQSAGARLLPAGAAPKTKKSIGSASARHTFSFSYDPDAAGGRGAVRATVDDLPEATFELPQGFRQQPFSFDRFGLMNGLRQGPRMTVYFGDLKIDDQPIDLAHDAGWDEHGNHDKYEAHEVAGVQNYGFSDTSYAGGERAGEIGGTIWRREHPSWYADRVGPLSLDQRIEASGRISLQVGSPDSGIVIGFFNAESIRDAKMQNLLGVQLEGPTRVGHYFRPIVVSAAGAHVRRDEGPVLVPDGKSHQWGFVYEPKDDGSGVARVTLDQAAIEIAVPAKIRSAGAVLNRFGLFPVLAGGSDVKVYLDDLTYTTNAPR